MYLAWGEISTAGTTSSKSDISDRKGFVKGTGQDKKSDKCTFFATLTK